MAGLNLRYWAAILIFILFVVGGWYFLSQFEEEREQLQDLDVHLSMQGIELVKAGQGGKKWQLKAQKAGYQKDKQIIELTDPEIVFYFAESNNTIQVKAPQGEVNQKENQAKLWPEVRAEYAQSTVITKRLDYNGSEQRAQLSGGVRIKSRQLSAQSRQGAIDLQKERLYLQGNVEVVLHEGVNVNGSQKR